jgi:beta-glucanase (GH16 family)
MSLVLPTAEKWAEGSEFGFGERASAHANKMAPLPQVQKLYGQIGSPSRSKKPRKTRLNQGRSNSPIPSRHF